VQCRKEEEKKKMLRATAKVFYMVNDYSSKLSFITFHGHIIFSFIAGT
jgi:hypothetical protein